MSPEVIVGRAFQIIIEVENRRDKLDDLIEQLGPHGEVLNSTEQTPSARQSERQRQTIRAFACRYR
ncbi:MAG: hypothetical protein AAGB11_09025 [Pseudomonadota bacterium]